MTMKTGKLTPYQAKLLADIAEGRRTMAPDGIVRNCPRCMAEADDAA